MNSDPSFSKALAPRVYKLHWPINNDNQKCLAEFELRPDPITDYILSDNKDNNLRQNFNEIQHIVEINRMDSL